MFLPTNYLGREKSGWNVKGRSWKYTQCIIATVPKWNCHNTLADFNILNKKKKKKKGLRLAQCFPFNILVFFDGKGAIVLTEWQWDKTQWNKNNRNNMFLQHLTGQVWGCFHFWWRKAKSETSGSYYSECGFQQQNIILPVLNHLENSNREWCQLEWKASTIFYSGPSPRCPTLIRQNCTKNKVVCIICTQFTVQCNHKCF